MSNSQSRISDSQSALKERERYVKAFNAMMVRIWREQISLLGVIDTGALYWRKRSIPTHSNGSIHSLLSPKIGLRSA